MSDRLAQTALNGHRETTVIPGQLDIFGAEAPLTPSTNGSTPASEASAGAQVNMEQRLLERGSNVVHDSDLGRTAMLTIGALGTAREHGQRLNDVIEARVGAGNIKRIIVEKLGRLELGLQTWQAGRSQKKADRAIAMAKHYQQVQSFGASGTVRLATEREAHVAERLEEIQARTKKKPRATGTPATA